MLFKNRISLQSGFCTKDEFDLAQRVTEACYQTGDPIFKAGFFGAGAVESVYGHGWFSIDYACIIDGAKWLDFGLARDFNRNMIDSQFEDGRIRLDTNDTHKASEKGLAVGCDAVSSLPQVFETAYRVAVMAGDGQLMRDTYTLLRRALDWWFRNRQDPGTKLITAVTEETFIANHVSPPMVYAPMDTNAFLIRGCENTALLAERLGEERDAQELRAKRAELIDAFETYLWNEEEGAYYPYLVTRGEQYRALLWHTFLGFAFTDAARRKKLVRLLLDHSHFNWDTYPVTSVSKRDKLFTEARSGFGPGYCSVDPSWRGSIWMPSNIFVMEALERGGRKDLAADLALKTVRIFSNYRLGEFANPITGIPEGLTMSYGWTAAGYLQVILEKLLGIDYTPEAGLTVRPNLPVDCPEAYRYISLDGLAVPDGRLADIRIERDDVRILFRDKKA